MISKVRKEIIGINSLNKYNFLIKPENILLLDAEKKLCVKGKVYSITFNNFSTLNITVKFQKYPDILKPNLLISNSKHDIQHFIFMVRPYERFVGSCEETLCFR